MFVARHLIRAESLCAVCNSAWMGAAWKIPTRLLDETTRPHEIGRSVVGGRWTRVLRWSALAICL